MIASESRIVWLAPALCCAMSSCHKSAPNIATMVDNSHVTIASHAVQLSSLCDFGTDIKWPRATIRAGTSVSMTGCNTLDQRWEEPFVVRITIDNASSEPISIPVSGVDDFALDGSERSVSIHMRLDNIGYITKLEGEVILKVDGGSRATIGVVWRSGRVGQPLRVKGFNEVAVQSSS